MAVQISIRRDTRANWTSANPVLALGEIGLITGEFPTPLRIGDGTHNWASLQEQHLDLTTDFNFKGEASPSTNPGTVTSACFYLAKTQGTYTNFSSIQLAAGEVAYLMNPGGSTWTKLFITNQPIFASGEEVNETYIDETHLVNPKDGALPLAEDTQLLAQKLRNINLTETKIDVTSDIIVDGYINSSGVPTSYSTTKSLIINVEGYDYVRFLGLVRKSSVSTPNYCCFYSDANGTSVLGSVISLGFNSVDEELLKEFIFPIPQGAKTFRCNYVSSSTAPLDSNFYCYLQIGHAPKIINDVTTGGEHDWLSAEQGKKLSESIPIIEGYWGDGIVPYIASLVSASQSTYGQIISSGGYKRTSYIPVEEGEVLEVKSQCSTTVFVVSAFDSSKSFINNSSINIVGNGSLITTTITIPAGVSYIIICCVNAQVSNSYIKKYTEGIFDDVELLNKFSSQNNKLLYDGKVVASDVGVGVISNNIANPQNIVSAIIDSSGKIIYNQAYKAIYIKVESGQKITFGGNDCGRNTYCSFFNTYPVYNVSVPISVVNIPRQTLIDGKTVTVPDNCNYLFFQLQFNGVPSSYIAHANYGETLLDYDEYKEGVTDINGMPIGGSELPADLEQRVEDIESNISELQQDVSALSNEGLIVDLPVSDGTGIEQGYAYIDNMTGVVKVKLS